MLANFEIHFTCALSQLRDGRFLFFQSQRVRQYSNTSYNVDNVVRNSTVIPCTTLPRTTLPRTTSAFELANVQHCTKQYSNTSYNIVQ